ncbi:MAG: serine/threonine-protein kinase [Microbacteriaceae bacterium]
MSTRLPSEPPPISGFSYVRPLGTGGFSDVYLYQQDMPRRQVAVKVLRNEGLGPEQLKMFHAEADVLAKLSSHPAILTVFQASITADGRPYLVMEYCPSSMSPRYRRERISVAEALAAGVSISSAIETVHRAGIFHRDITPSNILVTGFGAPVLSDFGIASARSGHTEEYFAMSIPWSAPEIIDEQIAGSVPAEVWSLGATVYSLLASRSPFEREGEGQNTKDKLSERIRQAKYQPINRPDLPIEVERILAKALAKNPADRYQSAAEFAVELQKAQVFLGHAMTPLELGGTAWTQESRNIALGDGALRGPSRAQVPVESKRKSRNPQSSSALSDDNIVEASKTPQTRNSVLWMLLGVAATVVVFTVLALTGLL